MWKRDFIVIMKTKSHSRLYLTSSFHNFQSPTLADKLLSWYCISYVAIFNIPWRYFNDKAIFYFVKLLFLKYTTLLFLCTFLQFYNLLPFLLRGYAICHPCLVVYSLSSQVFKHPICCLDFVIPSFLACCAVWLPGILFLLLLFCY